MKTADTNKTESEKAHQNSDSELFPIRILAEKTTIGTSTLRAWERRYGLLKPLRTPKGHRLYQAADVNRVHKIRQLLTDGHSLPDIARLLDSETTASDAITHYNQHNTSAELALVWQTFIRASIEASQDFNIERLDAIYNEATSLYPLDLVTEKLIVPAITLLGEAWKDQPGSGIAEEHFYTSWLKNRLGARFHHAYTQARGSRIICACVPGSFHEIGLMLFALSALSRGYRVLYFGADLPFDQLPHIAQRSAAKAIVLGTQSAMQDDTGAELNAFTSSIKIPVFLGGPDNLPGREKFEQSGGIFLGSNLPVALTVFENHIPVFSTARAGTKT